MKLFFDRKISDRTTTGFDVEQVKNWLSSIDGIDTFEYYYYPLGAKFPLDPTLLRNKPTVEIMSFLESHFTESADLFVEVQRKEYRSGKLEIILRGRNLSGEITKIAVLKTKKTKNNRSLSL